MCFTMAVDVRYGSNSAVNANVSSQLLQLLKYLWWICAIFRRIKYINNQIHHNFFSLKYNMHQISQFTKATLLWNVMFSTSTLNCMKKIVSNTSNDTYDDRIVKQLSAMFLFWQLLGDLTQQSVSFCQLTLEICIKTSSVENQQSLIKKCYVW